MYSAVVVRQMGTGNSLGREGIRSRISLPMNLQKAIVLLKATQKLDEPFNARITRLQCKDGSEVTSRKLSIGTPHMLRLSAPPVPRLLVRSRRP